MQFAAKNREATGQPFFLVTGIKRPHLNWRAPQGYVDMYPIETVKAPTQLTLDKSIDPIAYTVFPMNAPLGPGLPHSLDFVHGPEVHGTDMQLRYGLLRTPCSMLLAPCSLLLAARQLVNLSPLLIDTNNLLLPFCHQPPPPALLRRRLLG